MKKCRVCKHEFQPFSTTSVVCSLPCTLIHVENTRKKKEQKIVSDWKKDTRAKKKKFNDNDLSKQKQLTQTVFNKLRKLEEIKWYRDRGLEPECISCGKKNMDWCCSHLKTVGAHGHLRYDRDNTKLGCNRYCNKGLSGNINGNANTRGYLVGLVERFGEAEAKRIIDYCEIAKVKKWTCEELMKIRKQFNVEIRQLEENV